MFEQIQKKLAQYNFPAANCAAQIFTYVPMTLLFSLNYLTNGEFREKSLEYYEGKIPAYLTFICLIFSLSRHLISNYKNHPDFIDLKEAELKQEKAASMIISSMRRDKERIRLYLETKSTLRKEIIWSLLDEDMQKKSTEQMLAMFEP